MKFAHVSLLLATASLIRGDRGDQQFPQWILDHKNPTEEVFTDYLKKTFPKKFADKKWVERAFSNNKLLDLSDYQAGDTNYDKKCYWMDDFICQQPGFSTTRNHGRCYRPFLRLYRKNHPKLAGRLRAAKLLTKKEGGPCCSNKTDEDTGTCECVPKGGVVVDDGMSCCSGYAVLKNNIAVCGGIPPLGYNQPLIWGDDIVDYGLPIRQSDCMFKGTLVPEGDLRSKSDSQFRKKCGKRQCQVPEKAPHGDQEICCAGPNQLDWSRPADPTNKVCFCGRSDTKFSEYTSATPDSCCSKKLNTNGKCACIPANKDLRRHLGTNESDCCSGKSVKRNGIEWCAEATCTTRGKVVSKGAECCSTATLKDTVPAGKQCPCVPGGKTPKGGASVCCSESLNEDGTCAWIKTGGDVEEYFTESECFSGKKNANNKCVCMPPLSTKRDKKYIKPAHCCSGYIIDDNKSKHFGYCGCIRNTDSFDGEPSSKSYGSDKTHCCSGKVSSKRVCGCANPGEKFKQDEGMTRNDCCSKRKNSHFCLCGHKGSSSGKEDTDDEEEGEGGEEKLKQHSDGCCFGSFKGGCKCLPDGWQLPPNERGNPDAVCCSKGSSKDKKCPIACPHPKGSFSTFASKMWNGMRSHKAS